MFIKLTQVVSPTKSDPSFKGAEIELDCNPDLVEEFSYNDGKTTAVYYSSGRTIYVKEKLDKIRELRGENNG